MNRNSWGPKRSSRGRSAAAAGALALVVLLGSGGTWATASTTDSGAAPQPTSSAQPEEAAAPKALSQTIVDDVGEVVETPAVMARTASDAGAEPVETPTPEAPVEQGKEAPDKETPSSAPGAEDGALEETAAPEAPATEEAPLNDAAPNSPATPDDDEAPTADETDGIATFAIEDGALVWTVREVNTPVGGAKIRVQGPATYSWWSGTSWENNGDVVVEDCSAAPCAGPDKDPVSGQFRVTTLGSQSISSDGRYRVLQEEAPGNYRFVNADAWIEIPGYRAVPTQNPWTDDVWDFQNFPVRELGDYAPACAPQYVYGVSARGQIRQIVPGAGSATDFGTAATGVSSFNGLGIGLGGESVFAYERSDGNSEAAIRSFDTTSGSWGTTTLAFVDSKTSGRTVGFVAGAVDLNTGNYYIGGFDSNGRSFRIWEYEPGEHSASYKGYIDTSEGAGGSNNGDMAFDSAGNLFVVRSGTRTTVFSVTAANFRSANGGLITSSDSTSVTTMEDVNGVAFDASGKAYLGSGNVLRSYDTGTWKNPASVVGKNLNSTDLATCSSPATVTLEKDIPGGRFKASDQFLLELKQGTQTFGVATTVGSDSGIQEERVGPTPVVPGATLQFNESFVGSTNKADYATSWSCTVDGNPLVAASGTAGEVTVPVGADEVVCRITNQLLVATVNVHKEVADIEGAESAGAGWTVGAGVTATSGTATRSPGAATQATNASGDASWTVRFNSKEDRANVVVSEQMQGGYTFDRGACAVESFDGSLEEVEITEYEGLALKDVGPGDTVNCEFVNKQLPASVEVDKQWTINGGDPIAHGDQPAGLTADLTLDPNLDATPVWGEVREGFAVNDEVTIGETAGLDLELLPGCSLGDPVISGGRISEDTPLGKGMKVALTEATNSYTITNPVTCKQELTLVKTVVNGFTGERLPSDWLLDSDDWDGELFAHMGEDTSLTFNSAETKAVARGEYVITETAMPTYVFDSLTCVGGDLDEDTMTVAVDLGQLVTCTFTNKDAPGSVTWTKVDDSGVLLSGSEWKLESVGGDVATIVDCVEESAECTGYDKDPAAGQFKIDGLAWGEYALIETKAPAGFVLNPDPHEFTISMTQGDYVFEDGIVNEQRDPLAIPMTGGLGAYQFWMTAGLFGVLAAGGLLWQRRSQRRTVAVLRN